MKVLTYHLLLFAIPLLGSATFYECGHDPLYHIASPADCIWLSRTIRLRGDAILWFKMFHPGQRPIPGSEVVPITHVETYGSCSMSISLRYLQIQEDRSSWYKIAGHLISIFNYCQTGMYGWGGTATAGQRGALLVKLINGNMVESQANEAVEASLMNMTMAETGAMSER